MNTNLRECLQRDRDREEVALLFGTNQDPVYGPEGSDREGHQPHRLEPYAAKRLQVLLGEVIKQYESKFGALEIGVK